MEAPDAFQGSVRRWMQQQQMTQQQAATQDVTSHAQLESNIDAMVSTELQIRQLKEAIETLNQRISEEETKLDELSPQELEPVLNTRIMPDEKLQELLPAFAQSRDEHGQMRQELIDAGVLDQKDFVTARLSSLGRDVAHRAKRNIPFLEAKLQRLKQILRNDQRLNEPPRLDTLPRMEYAIWQKPTYDWVRSLVLDLIEDTLRHHVLFVPGLRVNYSELEWQLDEMRRAKHVLHVFRAIEMEVVREAAAAVASEVCLLPKYAQVRSESIVLRAITIDKELYPELKERLQFIRGARQGSVRNHTQHLRMIVRSEQALKVELKAISSAAAPVTNTPQTRNPTSTHSMPTPSPALGMASSSRAEVPAIVVTSSETIPSIDDAEQIAARHVQEMDADGVGEDIAPQTDGQHQDQDSEASSRSSRSAQKSARRGASSKGKGKGVQQPSSSTPSSSEQAQSTAALLPVMARDANAFAEYESQASRLHNLQLQQLSYKPYRPSTNDSLVKHERMFWLNIRTAIHAKKAPVTLGCSTVNRTCVSPNGRLVACLSQRHITVMRTLPRRPTLHLFASHDCGLTPVHVLSKVALPSNLMDFVWSLDCVSFAILTEDGAMRYCTLDNTVADLAAKQVRTVLLCSSLVPVNLRSPVAFAPDIALLGQQTHVLVGSTSGDIMEVSVVDSIMKESNSYTGATNTRYHGHENAVLCLFSTVEETIVSVDNEGHVCVWSPPTRLKSERQQRAEDQRIRHATQASARHQRGSSWRQHDRQGSGRNHQLPQDPMTISAIPWHQPKRVLHIQPYLDTFRWLEDEVIAMFELPKGRRAQRSSDTETKRKAALDDMRAMHLESEPFLVENDGLKLCYAPQGIGNTDFMAIVVEYVHKRRQGKIISAIYQRKCSKCRIASNGIFEAVASSAKDVIVTLAVFEATMTAPAHISVNVHELKHGTTYRVPDHLALTSSEMELLQASITTNQSRDHVQLIALPAITTACSDYMLLKHFGSIALFSLATGQLIPLALPISEKVLKSSMLSFLCNERSTDNVTLCITNTHKASARVLTIRTPLLESTAFPKTEPDKAALRRLAISFPHAHERILLIMEMRKLVMTAIDRALTPNSTVRSQCVCAWRCVEVRVCGVVVLQWSNKEPGMLLMMVFVTKW
eukprot:m.151932 g.151932  ORF g.151932 m.151932 type:complete len:1149 (+) comp14259_c0_seq5:313-3759(+)